MLERKRVISRSYCVSGTAYILYIFMILNDASTACELRGRVVHVAPDLIRIRLDGAAAPGTVVRTITAEQPSFLKIRKKVSNNSYEAIAAENININLHVGTQVCTDSIIKSDFPLEVKLDNYLGDNDSITRMLFDTGSIISSNDNFDISLQSDTKWNRVRITPKPNSIFSENNVPIISYDKLKTHLVDLNAKKYWANLHNQFHSNRESTALLPFGTNVNHTDATLIALIGEEIFVHFSLSVGRYIMLLSPNDDGAFIVLYPNLKSTDPEHKFDKFSYHQLHDVSGISIYATTVGRTRLILLESSIPRPVAAFLPPHLRTMRFLDHTGTRRLDPQKVGPGILSESREVVTKAGIDYLDGATWEVTSVSFDVIERARPR